MGDDNAPMPVVFACTGGEWVPVGVGSEPMHAPCWNPNATNPGPRELMDWDQGSVTAQLLDLLMPDIPLGDTGTHADGWHAVMVETVGRTYVWQYRRERKGRRRARFQRRVRRRAAYLRRMVVYGARLGVSDGAMEVRWSL